MTNTKYKQKLGKAGEDFGAEFLKRKGHDVIGRNWRGRYGELDLVSLDGDTLVFTEVKTRLSRRFGAPQNAVTPQKQQRLCMAALEFMAAHAYSDYNVRFDVLALTQTPAGFEPQWLTGAFEFNAGDGF